MAIHKSPHSYVHTYYAIPHLLIYLHLLHTNFVIRTVAG